MVVWAPENKFRLLLNIIGQNTSLSINYDELAASMGPEYTVESVKQAFKKIKNEAKNSASVNDGTMATPKKSIPRPRKPKDGGKRKGGHIDDDDEETEEKTHKKMKVEAKVEDED